MWHKDDFINLNGSISFREQAQVIEALRVIKYLFDIIFVAEDVTEDGVHYWVIDFTRNNIDPRFTNVLQQIGEQAQCSGTVTYAFNHRFETGMWRNRDFIRMQPRDLIAFASEKLLLQQSEITSEKYDFIKQQWLLRVWQIP